MANEHNTSANHDLCSQPECIEGLVVVYDGLKTEACKERKAMSNIQRLRKQMDDYLRMCPLMNSAKHLKHVEPSGRRWA